MERFETCKLTVSFDLIKELLFSFSSFLKKKKEKIIFLIVGTDFSLPEGEYSVKIPSKDYADCTLLCILKKNKTIIL